MRVRLLLPLLFAGALALPASAGAYVAHTIAPGESLYSLAAQDGVSVSQLAAANGLSSSSYLISGGTLQIPAQGVGPVYSTPASTQTVSTGDGDGDSDDVGDDVGATPSVSASSPSTRYVSSSTAGGYVVHPGDTLWALALEHGTTVAALAAANGLSPSGVLPAGIPLRLSGSSSGTAVPVSTTVSSGAQEPVGAPAQGNPSGPPYPTPERLSAGTIGTIGANNGATSSLADAIAWQESGFNNDLVSSADARGIMQILPGTWQWIQNSLVAGRSPLAPASAVDNVRGGSLMLGWLLRQTGGDPAMAAAGYYQGLSSVRRHGLFRDTQQYVNSVMSLRSRFGG